MPATWRAWIIVLAVAFAAGAYLAALNWDGGELRNAAENAARWDSRDRAREPSRAELEALPARARSMIDAQCNNEGGDPRVRRNCYAEAAEWMIEEAKEREPRRDLGLAGMVASAFFGAAGWFARRRARKRELSLQE